MFDWIRSRLLRAVRVPPEPEPPNGAAGSIRVFRAGRNYYKLRLFGWSVTQVGAAAGLAFSFAFLDRLETDVNKNRDARAKTVLTQASADTPTTDKAVAVTPPAEVTTEQPDKK